MPVRLPKSFLLGLVVLSGCAVTPPLDLAQVDRALQPADAVADIDATRGQRVAWGGVIVSSRNLEAQTEIEVLSFPLDPNSLWPDAEQPAQGRFLLRAEGYLETLDYAPGRYLVSRGRVDGLTTVQVGETRLQQPVLAADQVHLFRSRPAEPRVRFGFGLILSN